MKKLISIFISICIFFSCISINAFASNTISINIKKDSPQTDVNPLQYGININNEIGSTDGGIIANLVANNSFENEEKGWIFSSLNATYSTNDAMNKNNAHYEALSINGKGVLKNIGFSSDDKGAIHFVEGKAYDFSCYIKNIDFEGDIYAYLDSSGNENSIISLPKSSFSKNAWTEITGELTALKTENGCLSIIFDGNGSLEIDYITLTPADNHSVENDGWVNASITNEAFDALQNLNPSFVTYTLSNTSWVNTIGALSERVQNETSNIFGVHELFQLSKELGAEPIPCIDTADVEFGSADYLNLKQDILNLIDYANSSPLTSYYGALRSANGSEDSFNLKYILIKDDNGYDDIKSTVESKYSDVTVLNSASINMTEALKEDAHGIAKYTIGTTVMDYARLVEDSEPYCFPNAFSNTSISEKSGLVNLNSEKGEYAFSSNYYAQMIFANNIGKKDIETTVSFEKETEEIYQGVSIDDSHQIVYVKIVNPDSSKTVSINLDGFDDITGASIQSVSNGWKSASNQYGKQYIAPTENELKPNTNSLSVKLEANSVNVIRIAYGNNEKDSIYTIPSTVNTKTKKYIPPVIIAIIVALCVSIPVGAIIGFVLYKKVISRKKKGDE